MENLSEVLSRLDQRLSHIENELKELKNPQPAARPTPPAPPIKVQTPYTPPPLPKPAVTSSNLNSSTVLGAIGIIFVILAGVFFIKMSIDSGWLTPIRQLILAAAVGASFFVIPHLVPRAEQEYGAWLAGAGTTILHLCWLGAYSYHHLISTNQALFFATVIGLFSILVNLEKGNHVYVLVAMAGTYLAAPIVGYDLSQLNTLSVFLIIWNISFSATALLNKKRNILIIASYLAVLTVLILSGQTKGVDLNTDLIILQVIQFIIFAGALLSYSIYHKSPMTADESISILPILLLYYFTTVRIFDEINPDLASWFGIAIGLAVLLVYFIANKYMKQNIQSGSALLIFSSVAFVHSGFFQLLDDSYRPLGALLISGIILSLYKNNPNIVKIYKWPIVIFSFTFLYGALQTIFNSHNNESMFLYNMVYGLFIFAVLFGSAAFQNQAPEKKGELSLPTLFLLFAHVEVMLGLYRLSEKIADSSTLFLTAAWGVYALIILGLSYKRHDKLLGKSALVILLAVSLKAFLYDLSNTTSLIRVMCLLLEGLFLYGCGWIFKKMQGWETEYIANDKAH